MAQLLSGIFTGKYVPAWGLGGSMGPIKTAVDHPTAGMSCGGWAWPSSPLPVGTSQSPCSRAPLWLGQAPRGGNLLDGTAAGIPKD